MRITGNQVRAARELLDMHQETLAKAADISQTTLHLFERGTRIPRQSTIDAIQTALENRGISFTNGEKPSVMLDRSKAIIPT